MFSILLELFASLLASLNEKRKRKGERYSLATLSHSLTWNSQQSALDLDDKHSNRTGIKGETVVGGGGGVEAGEISLDHTSMI